MYQCVPTCASRSPRNTPSLVDDPVRSIQRARGVHPPLSITPSAMQAGCVDPQNPPAVLVFRHACYVYTRFQSDTTLVSHSRVLAGFIQTTAGVPIRTSPVHVKHRGAPLCRARIAASFHAPRRYLHYLGSPRFGPCQSGGGNKRSCVRPPIPVISLPREGRLTTPKSSAPYFVALRTYKSASSSWSDLDLLRLCTDPKTAFPYSACTHSPSSAAPMPTLP
jgi:hypothetical protein